METLETLLQCALCLWLERREELPTPFTNAKEAATASGLWLPTSVPSGVSFIGLTSYSMIASKGLAHMKQRCHCAEP
ncbi:hypothetical protein Y1Q_0010665 [Alligator mississippiensis]|uniref:Uncharacterized protein n=1 Tax=Alligator mississippiensis TaxID=8496 RepID=A0A151M6E1_ALLMI|nr:hypothetical protein Y1Q_0010665 [Alligator mississippiensis]